MASSSQSIKPQTYLIEEIENIEGLKLPSNGEVIGFFLYHHRVMPTKTLREIAKLTVSKIFEFYDKVINVPVFFDISLTFIE